MSYAETGYKLEIDLDDGKTEWVRTDPQPIELHPGGLGIRALSAYVAEEMSHAG